MLTSKAVRNKTELRVQELIIIAPSNTDTSKDSPVLYQSALIDAHNDKIGHFQKVRPYEEF